MRGEIINEYRRLNSEDQKAFRRWLWTNTICGAILLTGLIALTSKFPGDEVTPAQTAHAFNTQAKVIPYPRVH